MVTPAFSSRTTEEAFGRIATRMQSFLFLTKSHRAPPPSEHGGTRLHAHPNGRCGKEVDDAIRAVSGISGASARCSHDVFEAMCAPVIERTVRQRLPTVGASAALVLRVRRGTLRRLPLRLERPFHPGAGRQIELKCFTTVGLERDEIPGVAGVFEDDFVGLFTRAAVHGDDVARGDVVDQVVAGDFGHTVDGSEKEATTVRPAR